MDRDIDIRLKNLIDCLVLHINYICMSIYVFVVAAPCLYLFATQVWPNLRPETPTPDTGSKSTKICYRTVRNLQNYKKSTIPNGAMKIFVCFVVKAVNMYSDCSILKLKLVFVWVCWSIKKLSMLIGNFSHSAKDSKLYKVF